MSVDKIFIKSFLNNFEEESFSVKLWDEEEIKVGQDEPLFKVTLNKPIPKKELLSSATLAFSKSFKKFKGVNPTLYREEKRKFSNKLTQLPDK